MLFNHCIPKQNENVSIRYVVNYMYISYDNVMYAFLCMYIFGVPDCLWTSKLILNIMINEVISGMPQ